MAWEVDVEQKQGQIPHLTQGKHDALGILIPGAYEWGDSGAAAPEPVSGSNCVSQLVSEYQVCNRTRLLARVMELQLRYHRRIIQ